MPTFETTDPISVNIELGVGDVRLVAGERADTIVEVLPSNPTKREDVTAAEQTRVEYGAGRLLVKAPKGWRSLSPFRDGGSVDVLIELPAGSELTGDTAVAALHATGRLGDCRFGTGVGNVSLDETGALELRTGLGDVVVGRAAGDVEVKTGSGDVRIDMIDGSAVIKNSNGDSRIGEVAKDLKVNAANGDITVERAHAAVLAKTANGSVRLGIVRGSVVAETALGGLEIAIADGTAAWLDLHTGYGEVRSELGASEAPADGHDTVEVRARTGLGDITVVRA